MPTCEQCSTAIESLVAQYIEQLPSIGEIRHPIETFRPKEAKSCWICTKFLNWLETGHQDLFQRCHLKPIATEFSAFGFMIIRDSRTGMISFDIDLDIGVVGLDQDAECCQCSLLLIPIQTLSTNSFALSTRSTLHSNLALARKWIEQCQKDHILCNRRVDSWYPTRLLHIDRRTRKVRLIISKTHSPKGPYITLSHRWVTDMPVKLLTSTMTQLQIEVKTSSLPQSFQDALTITHHFGVSYLWIDALCIKQDKDELDWNIESQNMDKVYSNAFLNLSATMSSTGTESLLRERRLDSLQLSKINLFDSTQKNYFIVDGQTWKNEIDDAPLNQRGWVFQERFLARRILHFGPRQLAWECYESEGLEVFPDGLNQFSTLLCMTKRRAYKSLRQSPQERNESEIKNFTDEYHILVHNYSKCLLTRPGDKLIAFSGIPKSIQKTRGDSCVAGVWNLTLPFDLNWECDQLEQDSFPAREASFRAPSWSWASVNGAVNFPSISHDGAETLVTNWMFVQPKLLRSSSAINRTSIRLQGFLLPLQIKWLGDDISWFQILELQFNEEETIAPGGPTIDLDGPDGDVQALNQNRDIYWMPLFTTKEDIHGIIIGRISTSSNFRRFGRIQIPILNMFQKMEREGTQSSNYSGRITRSRRNFSNEMNKEDWRGQRLIEVMKTMKPVDITLK